MHAYMHACMHACVRVGRGVVEGGWVGHNVLLECIMAGVMNTSHMPSIPRVPWFQARHRIHTAFEGLRCLHHPSSQSQALRASAIHKPHQTKQP